MSAFPTPPRRYRHISVEQYLAENNDGQWWNEYVDGIVYPMPDSTTDHGLIRGGFIHACRGARATVDIHGFDYKLRVKTDQIDRFYYPDVFASRRHSQPGGSYFDTDAILVAKVMMPETERIDRGEKFDAYRQLPSLQEYALLATDAEELELFRRNTGWRREHYQGPAVVRLESISIATNVSNFYAQARRTTKPQH